MAYRKTTRRRTARSTARPARRSTRKPAARKATRGHGQTVRIVIQHEAATSASANPGGLDTPQVSSQTKKSKF